MRSIMLPLFLVSAIGVSSAALAAGPSTANGAIQSLDSKACTVTLADKVTYQFAPKCDFSKLKVGEKVAITWTMDGTNHKASAIKAV